MSFSGPLNLASSDFSWLLLSFWASCVALVVKNPSDNVAVQLLSCDSLQRQDCSTPGFFVLHHLSEFAQTHVHWVDDAIQPSHPLSPPSFPALNLSQQQGLFQWVGSSHQAAEVGGTRDMGSIPGSGRSPGDGNGYWLQYSCPENPMGRGTWQATVHGVAKNQTWLNDLACTPLLISSCLNLPFGIQGRSWKLESCLQETGDLKGLRAQGPHRAPLGFTLFFFFFFFFFFTLFLRDALERWGEQPESTPPSL